MSTVTGTDSQIITYLMRSRDDLIEAGERDRVYFRALVGELRQQIAAVLAIHKPSAAMGKYDPYCEGCYEAGGSDGAPSYPCDTARALGVS